jgi:hypothetical protein
MPEADDRLWRTARVGKNITVSLADPENGNAVISPEEPERGCYWTLIGAGPEDHQNALAELICSALNNATR